MSSSARDLSSLGHPPVLDSLDDIVDSYLLFPETLTLHNDPNAFGHFTERTPKPERLMRAEGEQVETTLKVERELATGRILGFHEVAFSSAGANAKNSTSLSRAPGPRDESTYGSASNYPFWPGGMEEPELPAEEDGEAEEGGLFDPAQFLSVPLGFDRGMNLGEGQNGEGDDAAGVINLAATLALEEGEMGGGLFAQEEKPKTDGSATGKADASAPRSNADGGFEPEDTGVPVLSITDAAPPSGPNETEWAVHVDISQPMSDFHQKVPQMAYTWPFELDTFQKQAVLRLEQNESVFVAAHTSAGKTVVAEYAIALSQKHMTRTIYTSPIKALSNQKFRDFKDTFNDVGLVTGDIQINPNATCLIMTTEILRSMLYNGSDIIRDLEYVIFDEVHYINDAERGVVWEEVLILLPDHVNIIMLSATVPNTLEFADWVGRTKKKKIYVISTLKRPVPLEHFLYTGANAKTRDDLFLLQDAAGNFLQDGYKKAVNAKKEKESKNKQQFGAKDKKNFVPIQQEKNIWITLVDYLSRKDKLPVVAFTLSRNRCDQNANLLTSLDLTTSMEKSDIHHFISKCVQRLKGTDRRLPQVLQLIELLKRGIGIHHSGILPILKEVVEMLFQKGWVKLLFATETFAMGVNMPARTVVFDNIRKHDGTQFRTLLPAEYIQMAGRAGRRGLDSTGTVILLCKGEVHDISELHRMMQGKPTMLESKFRLTYSMILNLLRVEQLRVEDMMKRSFSEITNQKNKSSHSERLKHLKAKLSQLPQPVGSGDETMEKFYNVATMYLQSKAENWKLLLSHAIDIKILVPGRVLIINHGRETNKLCVLLAVDNKSVTKSYSVFILNEEYAVAEGEEQSEKFMQYLALASEISRGYGPSSSHDVVTVYDEGIQDITTKTVKVDAEKIISDVKKRKAPRFKHDPPFQATNAAVQELIKLSDPSLPIVPIDIVKDLRIQQLDLLPILENMQICRREIDDMDVKTVDFVDRFQKVFNRFSVQQEIEDIEYLLSEQSLTHLPDYHNRIEVLKKLKYIDDNSTVKLKGRVACEMGSQELMVTELVLDNLLTNLPPAEIAALLSCMVFQQRNCSKPEINERLQDGIDKIKSCAEMIGTVQQQCGMKQAVGDYVEQFNFGLVEVVYEWARGMPFAEITQLTDVQEGVIVRTIQRLDETLRDVKDAARVIGDSMLYQKMDESSTIIKRDIVFAASLYTQ